MVCVCVVAARRRSTAAASVLLPQPYLQHDVHHTRPAAAARHHVSTARRLAVRNCRRPQLTFTDIKL